MARAEHKTTAKVIGSWLYGAEESVQLDTPDWVAWLAEHTTFYLESSQGTLTARREVRGPAHYWYAYRRYHGKLYKSYLGKAEEVTRERLQMIAQALADKADA
ncbi:MAG: hypothetical protein H0X37_20920 [Herpetosiphonaceae bacterium]|nr:hypothetical protein [Herpetosiphonaceae bacterium]